MNIKDLNKPTLIRRSLAVLTSLWLIYSIGREVITTDKTFLLNVLREAWKLLFLIIQPVKFWYFVLPLILIVYLILHKGKKEIDLGIVYHFNAYWFKNKNKTKIDPNPLCNCCNPPKRLSLVGRSTQDDGRVIPKFKCPAKDRVFSLRDRAGKPLVLKEAVDMINMMEFPEEKKD